MADTNLQVRFKHPYKTEAEWEATTTIPKAGEALYTSGGLRHGWMKLGNGTDLWKDLPYIKPTYDYSEIQPLKKQTYTNVYCSSNSDPAGYLYFATVKPENYNKSWRISYRLKATINGISNGYQYSEVTIDGARNTYAAYKIYNAINNTSYRPLYSHVYHAATETGLNNNYNHLLGFRFQSSYNPHVVANSRIIEIEILEEENCTLTFLDSMTLFADMPGANTTNYGNTTNGVNATRIAFDGVTQGYSVSGDRNTYPYFTTAYYTKPLAGTNGIKQYSLIMEDSSGNYQSFTTDYGTGTSKTKNTTGFKLGKLYYADTSSNWASGSRYGNDVTRAFQYGVDARYSFNCGQTLTAYAPIYLVGTYNNASGLFYLDDTWYTQTLPTTEDGKIYIYLGFTYSNYTFDFVGYSTPLWFKDGAIRPFVANEATSSVAGLMSAEDKDKLDTLTMGTATMPAGVGKAVGWYRIAKIGNDAAGYPNFSLYITGGWASGSPTIGEFNISVRDSGARITQISAITGQVVSKIRLIRIGTTGGNYFVDVYQNFAYNSSQHMSEQVFKFIGHGVLNTYDPETALTGDDANATATVEFTLKDNGMVAPNFYGNATSATTATTAVTATNLNTSVASSAGDRPIWMSWINSDNKRATYDNDFTYDSSTDTLKVKKIDSPELTGTPKAPTATSGTNSAQIATTAFVQNAVGDTEIGGRNLVKDSYLPVSYGVATSQYWYKTWYLYELPYKVNDEFVASADIDVIAGNVTSVTFYLYNTTDGGCSNTCTGEIINGRASATIKVTKAATKDLTLLIYCGIAGATKDNNITVSKVKLERGNKPTDWTPAPEDLVSDITLSGTTLSYKNPVGTQLGSYTLSKSNVGLGNVDNTCDANKPISTATQNALDQLSAKVGNAKQFTGTCSSAANATAKVVTCTAFTADDLVKGTRISVYFDNTNTGARENLTLNVNNTGAKSIQYIYNGTYESIPGNNFIKAGQIYNFTYDGTYWVVDMMYNTDADWKVRSDYGSYTAGSVALFPYSLILQTSDGHWESIVTSSTTSANKTKNSHGFLLGSIFYKDGGASVAAGAVDRTWRFASNTVADGRYHFNLENTAEKQLVVGNNLYLVGTIGSDGLFYLDDTWWSQSLPTTDDGKCYIYLGAVYSWCQYNLDVFHPIFRHDGDSVKQISLDSLTVNGHTIEANVPSNAVFTDTKVTQTLSSTNANYPLILGKNTTSTTTNYTDTVLRNNSIYANPSTGVLTAPILSSTGPLRTQRDILSVASAYFSGFEFILYTGVKWANGGGMPIIHVRGYDYSSHLSPIDLLINFYMYDGYFTNYGAVDNGGWHPDIYLFKYQKNSTDYVALALTDGTQRNFMSFHADVLDVMCSTRNIDPTGFSWVSTTGTAESVIPEAGDAHTCIQVPYKTNYNPKPTLTIQGNSTNIGTYDGSSTSTINITKSSIGLGNVENKSSATIRGELTSSNVTTALGYTPVSKAGDTMTGPLTLLSNQYGDNYNSYALNLSNSNIVGVNSIYTADLSDNAQEGIHFFRTSTTVDSLWAKNGVLYFAPNRTLGQDGTSYAILNENNYVNYAPQIRNNSDSYLFNKGVYVGGSGARKYARIKLPDSMKTAWTMVYMEVAIRGDHSHGQGGKILINTYHGATSPYAWTQFNATIIGNLSDGVAVFGSDGQYFYIEHNFAYRNCVVERLIIGDSARSVDMSNIVVDFVDTLPETYQTATMYYGLHTGNISTHLNDIYVRKSGDTMSGSLVINPPSGAYNEGVRINKAPSGWSAVVLGGDANSTAGVTDSVWGIYTYNKNMYLSHGGSSDGSPRLVGTANGWELQGNRTYINGILQATHIANGNGQGNVILCDSPLVTTNNTLVNDPNTKLTSSTNIDEWIKALLKQICVTYPGRSDTIFRGWIGPSSRAYYEIYIYNTSVVDSTTGLPQYSFGRFNQLDNTTLYIYTHQYEFTHNTMIHTANYTAWFVPKSGGTFSGNVTINGNLTIGSGKNIILPNNYGIAGTLANGSTTNTWMLYMGSDDKVRLSYNNREVISLGKITSSNGFEGDLIGHASLDLPLTGGTLTGPLKWNDGNALPQATSASYLLTIDSFANGGTTKWITTDNVKVGSATKDGNGNVIATSYVNYGGNDQGLGSGTTAAKAKEYFANAEKVPAGMIKFFYNNAGSEKTIVFSKAPSSSYGSVLNWGYGDQYLHILRYQAGAWKSDDWEKIFAGYADSAGYTQKLYSSNPLTADTIDDFVETNYIKWARVSGLNNGLASNDGMIVSIPWSTAYAAQLAFDDSANRIFLRTKANTAWNNWTRIVDKDYGDTLYLSKTGTHDHTVMDLSFGTKGLAGSLDPITAYNIGPSASNKTFGLPAEAITVEYSTDAGATWQDYGLSDYSKKALFAETREQWIYAGKNSTNGQGSTNYWLRVTIYPSDGRYAYVNGLYLWVSRAGVTATVDLQRSTRGNPDTFTEVFSGQDIAGWSGNNIRYFSSNSFGGSAGQTTNGYKYRMIFKITSITDANYGTLSVSDIRFLGSSVYSYPSGNYMMKHNRLYTWDADLNAVFPANITATKFIAPIIQTGTDSTSYFQSQKFRGQGDANSYYHAIDFGYGGHNQVDFYEYGGLYNFWKNTGSGTSTAVLLGKITTNGWEGNVVGNVTGTATTATTANEAKALITLGDKRSVATTPNDYKNNIVFAGLKNKATVNNPSNDTYSYVVGLRGWADSSGGKAHEMAFNDSGIYTRMGSTTSWESWRRLLDSVNYSSYALPLTGGTLSGNLDVGGRVTVTTGVGTNGKTQAADGKTGVWLNNAGNAFLIGPANGGSYIYFYYNQATTATSYIHESASGTLKLYNDVSVNHALYVTANTYVTGALGTGGRTAYNDTDHFGCWLATNGEVHLASSATSGGAISFHYNKSASVTSYIKETASGQLKVSDELYTGGHIAIDTNAKYIYSKFNDDTNRILCGVNANNEILFGYGSFKDSIGSTHLEGNTVSIASRGSIYLQPSNTTWLTVSAGNAVISTTAGTGVYFKVKNSHHEGSLYASDSSDANFGIYSNTLGRWVLYVNKNNSLYLPPAGMQTSASGANCRLEGNGQILKAASSSKRYKHDIKPLINYKDILNIPVVSFKYNDDYLLQNDPCYGVDVPGFIAEDVEKCYPIATEYSNGKVENWNFRHIIPPMLAIEQEHEKRINELETKVEQLSQENEQLKQRIEAMT